MDAMWSRNNDSVIYLLQNALAGVQVSVKKKVKITNTIFV